MSLNAKDRRHGHGLEIITTGHQLDFRDDLYALADLILQEPRRGAANIELTVDTLVQVNEGVVLPNFLRHQKKKKKKKI